MPAVRFQIQTYRREHLDGLTALYNDQTAHEPHVAPLDCDRFIRLVEGKSYFDPAGLLVAVEEGRVVGWVHACVAAGTEPWQDGQKTLPRIRDRKSVV